MSSMGVLYYLTRIKVHILHVILTWTQLKDNAQTWTVPKKKPGTNSKTPPTIHNAMATFSPCPNLDWERKALALQQTNVGIKLW